MSERKQLALLQLAGFAAVLIGCGIALAATVYAPTLPALGIALASAISWYVGKLVATPLNAVTLKAVDSMPPDATAELVTRIATSSPPQRMIQVMESLAPAARQQIQIILEAASTPPPPPPPPPDAPPDAPPVTK